MKPIISSELSFNEKLVLLEGQIPVWMHGSECTNLLMQLQERDQT
jgi:hypothetical protein